jgi:hypothetical protein
MGRILRDYVEEELSCTSLVRQIVIAAAPIELGRQGC